MGFLLGAYGKLAAGKRLRSLQARMMRVQSDLRRATRDIEQQEKILNQQEKAMKMMSQSAIAGFMQSMSMSLQPSIFDAMKNEFGDKIQNAVNENGTIDYTKLDKEQAQYMTTISQQMTTQFQYQQQAMQSALAQQNAMTENAFEEWKELQLQPLKDYEDELQTEKDSLETQIQLAQQDYDACKEMEKAGAKNLAPQYTGQG